METQNQFSAKGFLELLPGLFSNLTKEEQELSLAIYKEIEKGKPVNINDLESAVQWLQIVQSIGPEVLFGTVKVEDFAEWSAEKLGVDLKLARDKGERANMEEQIAQLIVAAQAAQAEKPAAA